MSENKESLIIAEKKVTISFLFIGIASLGTFNAILAELFFFQHFTKTNNLAGIFTSINNGLNLSLLLIFQIFGSIISLTKQLILFQILGLVVLISSPLIVLNLPANISFYCVCLLFSLTGISQALANYSVFAVVSYFPLTNTVKVGQGQAIAGIMSNVINFAVLFLFGESSDSSIKKGALCFFFMTAGMIVISLMLTHSLFKNEFFLKIATQYKIIKKIDESQNNQIKAESENLVENENQDNKEEKQPSLVEVIKSLALVNFLMFLLFFSTFLIFPACLIKPKFFNLEGGVKVNCILLVFNLSDALGRTLTEKIKISMKNLTIVIILKILLIGSVFFIPYAEYYQLCPSWFLHFLIILNPSLLAILNGMGTSLAYSIAPSQVVDSMKGKAGASMSLFLSVGMFVGSIFSIKFLNLLNFK